MVFYGDYPMQWRTAEGCGASGTLPPTAIAKMADPQQTICISPRPAIPYVRGIGDAAPYSNRKNNSPQQTICIPPRPAIPYVRGIGDAAPHTAIAKITAPNKQFVFSPVLCNPPSCRRGQRPRCPVEQFGILHCFQPNILDTPHPSPHPTAAGRPQTPTTKSLIPAPPCKQKQKQIPQPSPHPPPPPPKKKLTKPPPNTIIK